MDNRNVSIVTKIVSYMIMGIFTIMTAYPLFWLIIQSFKSNQVYTTTNRLSLPKELFWGNYDFIWNQLDFQNYFVNSVIYSVITVVVVVLLANMAGYAFAKLKFRITKLLHGMFIVGLLLTIQSILIPLFLMVNAVGLFNTRLGILIPYIGLALPMGIYLCTDYIKKGVPDELLESATIDGANHFNAFTRIVLPMSTPVSITLAIVTFTATWNEFILMNLLTSGNKYKAIPAAVGQFAGALGADYGKLFTSLTISVIPILIFYFIFRKQITKGVAAGAVKG